jgi:hypothetical protein
MVRKLIIILVVFGVLYGLYVFGTRNASVTLTESLEIESERTYRDVTNYTLTDGVAEAQTALGGESMTTIRYFGNELFHDVDGDGEEDVVFLVTQETGGSGTFFYAVGALKRGEEYVGTHAVYLGDRIAPQSTTAGEGRQVVVNFAERAPGEPMTASPSIGTSMYLLLDVDTLEFGEVVQDFEGEEGYIE